MWNARVKTCTKTMVVETDSVGSPKKTVGGREGDKEKGQSSEEVTCRQHLST